ncbi:hypothetical protein Athai_11810 [Actinocatenispora thailandica]|uniref:Aminoglycoside phosphotransferase domain-containing protein n=1 Tax=Actinocatenispora thailandica TaxID=227318 RepID=A0A7R7HVE9_9ACTN|nr:phosphotransferase [Actinocatenispora thailandica]BCJ33678.1 hypothetical protein Athai_11810 [Actinocatenispora thailandica]
MSWQRARRLDGPDLVARVSAATGVPLSYRGRCPGGEVGAAYVCWPDGRPGVLTWQPGSLLGRQRAIAELLALARSRGVPAPAYRLVVPLTVGGEPAVAVVQERLPGAPPDRFDEALIGAMLAAHERFAGLLADRSDVPPAALYLTGDGPGFCLHGPLAGHDRRSARLLSWIEAVGAVSTPTMAGDDLVHLDFHPGNVLVDGSGALTGIVDWDGAARGDHRFDLVTLRFAVPPDRPALAARLDAELAARLTADELRPYWASMALRQVDWAIRHHDARTVQRWLTLAETRVD